MKSFSEVCFAQMNPITVKPATEKLTYKKLQPGT